MKSAEDLPTLSTVLSSPKVMKIIQLCPYDIDRPGGVQHHIRSLCQELRRRGHETLTIAPGPAPGSSLADVVYLGRHRRVTFSETNFEITWVGAGELDQLQHLLAEWKPDILHCHGIWVPFLPAQVLRRVRLPTVASFHDTPPDNFSGRILLFVFRQLSRWLLSRLDGAIAVSPAPMTHLRPSPYATQPIILPPGIDLRPFAGLKASRTSGKGEFSLLFVGRLEPRKGIKILLDAWRIVQASKARFNGRSFTLTIAGAGELEKLVLRNKTADDRLVFIRAPSDDKVKSLFESADLLIAPSPHGESFGIIIVE